MTQTDFSKLANALWDQKQISVILCKDWFVNFVYCNFMFISVLHSLFPVRAIRREAGAAKGLVG